jgi:hypothetical protein
VTLQNLDDPALHAIVVAPALDADHDPVAVHGLVHVRSRHEDVAPDVVQACLRLDKRVSARMHADASDDEVHFLGQPVEATPRLDQMAFGHELLEPAPE